MLVVHRLYALVCNASANKSGPDCQQEIIPLADASQMLSGSASASMIYYKFAVDGINKTRISFSVAALESNKPTPQVFIRWRNLPDANTYDFVGCSTEFCGVNQVNLEVLFGYYGDWYIGIMSNRTEYGIWHGNICPNNCTDHGICNNEGEMMGTCSCSANWSGLDCSILLGCVNNCSSHGRCDEEAGNYACICDTGYTSNDCGIMLPHCPNNCSSHGTCSGAAGNYTCICDNGYASADCSNSAIHDLHVEYLVLLLLGGIIALSTIIGLVTWVCMGRRNSFRKIQ